MDGDDLNFLIKRKIYFFQNYKKCASLWCAFMCACTKALFPCGAANVTFVVPCQHCQHLNISPCCTSLSCSENVITDRRRTNGKERDTNAKKLTASRAFSPLLILCTSFSSSAKLVTGKKKNCYRSHLCQFSCAAILYNCGGKCCVLISISINFTSKR